MACTPAMKALLRYRIILFAIGLLWSEYSGDLFLLSLLDVDSDESYSNRVHLFPIALGAKAGSFTIDIKDRNAGNAQAQRTGVTVGEGETRIMMECLDDILDSDINMTQMKMDAQGFECFIVYGMPPTLRNTTPE